MAATPKYGVMNFEGKVTGESYSVDIYLSDVADALINWDSGAGAGASTDTFWQAPEDVELVDYAQVTGTVDTVKLQLTRNGVPTGDMLRYEIHLTTLNNRPDLAVAFSAGDRIGALQKA